MKKIKRYVVILLITIIVPLFFGSFSVKAVTTSTEKMYVKYIKVWAECRYEQDGPNHIMALGPKFSEVKAYVGYSNVALHAKVYGTNGLEYADEVTDGLTYDEDEANYAYYMIGECEDSNLHNVVIELNKPELIDIIKICVIGKLTKVEVVDEDLNMTTVYDKNKDNLVYEDGYQVIKLNK